MTGRVIRFADYDRRSRDADSCHPRHPDDTALIIILPIIRIERFDAPDPAVRAKRLRRKFGRKTTT